MPKHQLKCPYSIPNLPFSLSDEKKWTAISPASGYAFFRYESWLRSPRVWHHARNASKNGQSASKVTIGGLSLQVLPWLLTKGHHALLCKAEDAAVLDLGTYLAFYGSPWTPRAQNLANEKLTVFANQLMESARIRSKGQSTPSLFLLINTHCNVNQILEEVRRLVEAKRRTRAPDMMILAENDADVLAVRTQSAKGKPADWGAWARRLRVWDIRQSQPQPTFREIYDQLQTGCYAGMSGRYENQQKTKLAQGDYKDANKMIEAATRGGSAWPPRF